MWVALNTDYSSKGKTGTSNSKRAHRILQATKRGEDTTQYCQIQSRRPSCTDGYPEPRFKLPLVALLQSIVAGLCFHTAQGDEPTIQPHAAVDLLVIGGTPAGIAAAIGAATLGKDILIIEQSPVLGGVHSLESSVQPICMQPPTAVSWNPSVGESEIIELSLLPTPW